MRIVVTGATGNVGTALLARLLADPEVEEVTGIARREPTIRPPRTRWLARDVGRDDLLPAMRGADAVVHLAWTISPSHDQRAMWRANVLGSRRVFATAAEAGVPALVHASSVGVYSPGPKDHAVDEGWPRMGTRSSLYAVHKAEAERSLDAIERSAPSMRVVRMRPGLCFSRHAASGIRRLFLGPLVPRGLLRPSRIPIVPDLPGLRFQAAHSDDVAEAYHAAVRSGARGAFNVASDPVLDPPALAEALGARLVPAAAPALRAAISASWHARLQPTSPGWLDMALAVPIMSCARARDELGWEPRVPADLALREVLVGMADAAGTATPPLAPGRAA
jgi:nucleoside-diphosphate-sugar epimerase